MRALRHPASILALVGLAALGPLRGSPENSDAAAIQSRQFVPGQTIKRPDYLGRIRGEQSKSLAIAIIERTASGRAVRGRFEPRSITLACRGPSPYVSEIHGQLPPIPIYFRPGGTVFDGSAYSISGVGDESTALIHGELERKGRRASGTIVYTERIGGENGSYCSTGGRRPWSAVRLHR